MHPSKNSVNYHHNFSQTLLLTGNYSSVSLVGNVFTVIVLPSQMHFLQLSQSVRLYRSSGRCLHGTNISISSENCNRASELQAKVYLPSAQVFKLVT